MLTRGPAGAFQDGDVLGVFHDYGSGALVGYHLLEVVDMQVFVERNQLFGGLQRHSLAVISVRKTDLSLGVLALFMFRGKFVEPAGKERIPFGEGMLTDPDADI